MVCPNCGANNPGDLRLCAQCGRGLQGPDDGQTAVVDAGAAAAPAKAPIPSELTWGAAPLQPGAQVPGSLAPGTFIGSRYRVEALLGEGGMGAVYRAHDEELNRTVALKLVRPELATNPQVMKRFKQELLLASRISHKNILRIHDLGDWNGVKFITMAFVEGPDLAAILAREGRLPFDRTLKITRQLCGALEAAHNEGVVHRDLKPQNILVDAADNVYVSDFGLAKSLEAEASAMTRTGQILGTPRYMAPEQVEAKEIDHRADLYSLGLIVYQMFTGDLPFRGDSAMQLMYQRVNEAPRDPREVCPDVPEYVANIVLKCLAKDPSKRYQSAGEILADLDSMNAPSPEKAGSATISIQLPKPTRRGGLLALGGLAAVGILLAAVPATRHAIGAAILRGGAQPAIQHYIGVLPMNIGDAAGLKYLADGVNDALAAKLSVLRNVYVATATPTVLKEVSDEKIAHAMGVKILVKGNLQASGDQIAITLHMLDVANHKELLKLTEFQGSRADLLTLEANAFNKLADALVIRQTSEEKARTALQPTQNVEAYELYLKGKNLIRGAQNQAKAEQALDLFNQAARLDPAFALAYAGVADCYLVLFNETKKPEWLQTALGAAQQAKRLNDNLSEVHNSLGTIYSRLGKNGEAIAELRRATDLDPNSDEAFRRLGLAYREAGQLALAVEPLRKATTINPYLWSNFNVLGNTYFRLGQNQKMLEAYTEVTRLEPGNATGWANTGVAKYRMGQAREAIPDFQKAIALQPKAVFYTQLGVANFFLGQFADAAKAFETAVQLAPKIPLYQVNLADSYRWSNQPEKAAKTYDEAIALSFQALETKPNDTAALACLATAYAKKGDLAKAQTFIRQARQIDASDNDLMYRAATIAALGKDSEGALAALKEALQNGYSAEEANADPEFKELRADPRWARTLREAAAKPTK